MGDMAFALGREKGGPHPGTAQSGSAKPKNGRAE
jgi:hypothetical protein